MFTVRVDEDPAQWSRAWLVYELGEGSHWSAIRRKINDGVIQGGFRPSRASVGGTQVEEIAPSWVARGDNTVRFEPRDNVDATGFTVASVRIVATREASTQAEPLAVPLEAHGSAYARWTDGEPSTAVTGAERNAADRSGLWTWRDPARIDAIDVLTRGTGTTQLELSWTASDGRTRARRTIDVPANARQGTSDRLQISPPIDASDLRVSVLARGERPTLAVAELDVHATATATDSGARLAITWPAHGECVDREAYVRGFALGRDGRPATEVLIDDQPSVTQSNADGSFGVLLALDERASSSESPSEHRVEARFSDGTTKHQRFVLGRCVASAATNAANNTDAPREDVGAPFGGWARANADTTLTLGDVVVEIPAGAVARDTRITLRPLPASDVAALDRGMINTSPDGRAYRFGPDGLRFSKPIRLSLPFSRARLSAGTTDADVKTFYFDGGARRWREVTRIATGANDRIAAATNHFTDYITATITSPDSPQSTAFDANTIQGLQAANPAAGVQMIAPPTPNSTGSANLSFPIVVPPGRQGMQPSLALSYDSARANGPLGVGWDLGVSRIEVDTRNGVPEYTATSEESYLLDGAQLVPEDGPSANPRRYRRRIEGAFDRIYRHGTSKSEFWWDVRTRDGARLIYGRRNGPPVGGSSFPDHGRLSETGSSAIGRWMLEESRDEFNNAVIYHYEVHRGDLPGTTSAPAANVVEQYLKSIEYTVRFDSFESDVVTTPSNYFVDFDYNFVRQDVTSSARLGFLVRNSGLLASVLVRQAGSAGRIRRYTLTYATGDFGKSLLHSVSVAGVTGSTDLYTHTFAYSQAQRFDGRVGFASPTHYANTPEQWTSGGSNGGGANVAVGVGDAFHVINVGGGGGGGAQDSRSEFERVDVNGDGLPDQLTAHLVTQTPNATPTTRFNAAPVFTGHSTLSETSSRNGQLNIGLHLFDMGGGGVDGAWSWNNTSRLLSDANGDGFVDIVTGPHDLDVMGVSTKVLRVFENPTPYGRTTFGSMGGAAHDYTIGGITVQPPSVTVTDERLIDAIATQNRPTAPLALWTVLKQGSVRITGAIEHPDTRGDGVVAEIYLAQGGFSTSTLLPVWSRPISATDPPCTPGPANSCGTGLDLNNLSTNDRIYFVVRPGTASTSTVDGDLVHWWPRITYTAVDPTYRCTDNNLGCPWPGTAVPISVGTYFDRGEDFRVADRDIAGFVSIRRGKLAIESAPITLPPGVSASARIWVRRVRDTSSMLPPEPTGLPAYDSGTGDASSDATPPTAMTPSEIDARLSGLEVVVIPVTAATPIPAGGGTGPSVSNFDTYQGDQFFFSIDLPNDAVDPALVQWQPLVHYTEWCGPNPSGVTSCPPITDCNTPAALGPDGTTPGCRWQNPTPLGPDAHQWIPLAVVQQPRPLLAVSDSDKPSELVDLPPSGPYPITNRRILLATGWYRGWGAGEWRADVPGIIERNLIDPMWSAATPSTTPGAISGDPIASRQTPVFMGMAAQRLPLDASADSVAMRVMYGVPPTWTIVAGAPEELQWIGSGRVSAINRWSMIPSRRGGFRTETLPTGGARIVPDGDWMLSASEGASLRAANGPTGGFNLTLMGVGAGLNAGQSTTTLDFFDVNGDRLPDSVEPGAVRLHQRRAPGATHTTLAPPRPMPGMLDAVRRSNDMAVRYGFSIGSAAGGIRRAVKMSGSLSSSMGRALTYGGYAPSFGLADGRTGDVIDWLDVNGDGLPDQVQAGDDSVSVSFNLGTRFTAPQPIYFDGGIGKDEPAEREIDSLNLTTSKNTNVEFGFLGSGGGASLSFSYGQSRFIDVNGDGLPDRVWVPSVRNGRLRVRFNFGSHFGPPVDWNAPSWSTAGQTVPTEEDVLSFSWGAGLKLTLGVPIMIPWIGIWGVSIVPSLGMNFGAQHLAGRITLEDINGDGLVDHVLSPPSAPGIPPPTNKLFARLNATGGANLLKQVNGPFGARIDLTYALVGNRVETLPGGERVDMPSARYVLSSVRVPGTTQETPEGPNTEYITTISYGGGFYDRNEREDYGFSSVTVCNNQNTCSVTNYNNQSYLLRGTVSSSYVRDSVGHRTSGSEVVYETSTDNLPTGVTHVRPKFERRFIYNPTIVNPTEPSITTEVERTYDSQGRLLSIIDRGEDGTADDVHANITKYFVAAAPYNIVRPETIELRDHGAALLRMREATFGIVGELLSVTDRLTGGTNPDLGTPAPYVNHAVTTTFTYDQWGNVVTVTDPAGLVLTYTYEGTRTHRASITDNFGLSSSMLYDMRFGAVQRTTDSNGHHVHVQFDDFGRTTAVFGPYDDPLTTTPTISYEYQLQPGVSVFPRAWAITHHKDPGRTTTIDTVTFIDRTMRVIQTKKTAEFDSGTGTSTTVGWTISGPVEYDGLGRARRQYRGGFDATASATHFVELVRSHLTDPHTTTDYDAFDRARVVHAPDGTQVSTDYFIAPIPDALDTTPRLHTRTTDPLGHQRHSYARADGSVLEVRENNTIGGTSTLLRTRYTYDVLGRLTQVLDANNNPTTATYDSLGRMISLENRDSGLIEYHYTASGELGAKVTPNLRAVTPAQRIRYVHDKHRLTQVLYPDGRTVNLYYGGAGAWGNGAGRLQTRVDDSGSTYLAYGALGETTWTWRYLQPAGSVTTATSVSTSWTYDSFGRQRSITYNDWETVDYHYDRGGNLQSVTGTPYGGTPRDYLKFVGYDQYGQRSRVTLGNGTETRYQRDPLMQRLQEVNTNGPGSTALQRLQYYYNAAGNITGRDQNLPSLMGAGFGGDVFQEFDYDEIGQLTSATGFYQESGTHERRYTLAMQYDTIGNITNKTQNDVRSLIGGGSPTTLAGTSHALSYTYLGGGSIRPHAATKVGNRTFTFDPNGNQLGWSDSGTGSTRSMAWDEDDRLESVTTDGSTVNFLYDGAGERTHKYSSAGVSVYANAYWSVRNGVQTTKHIFASGQRIASVVNDPATGTQEHWFHTDHLGSTQFVTDAAGAVREHHESFPFGEPWIEESSASDTTPFRFTGKELDPETGLQYFGARYYDPRQGQWASVDPALRSTLGSFRPIWLSVYAYASNSPIRRVDPDGRLDRDQEEAMEEMWLGMVPFYGPMRALLRDSRDPRLSTNAQLAMTIVNVGFVTLDIASLGLARMGSPARTVIRGFALAAGGSSGGRTAALYVLRQECIDAVRAEGAIAVRERVQAAFNRRHTELLNVTVARGVTLRDEHMARHVAQTSEEAAGRASGRLVETPGRLATGGEQTSVTSFSTGEDLYSALEQVVSRTSFDELPFNGRGNSVGTQSATTPWISVSGVNGTVTRPNGSTSPVSQVSLWVSRTRSTPTAPWAYQIETVRGQ